MSQGSLNTNIKFLGQKMCSVARRHTDGHCRTHTHESVYRGHPFKVSCFCSFNLSSRIGLTVWHTIIVATLDAEFNILEMHIVFYYDWSAYYCLYVKTIYKVVYNIFAQYISVILLPFRQLPKYGQIYSIHKNKMTDWCHDTLIDWLNQKLKLRISSRDERMVCVI